MKGRKILIVDKDLKARQRLADYFQESNYQVDTSGSAAYLVAHIIQKHEPIVLLGSSFDERISVVDVISLLHEFNKQLNIILISDENSPMMLRRIREEGIFYHALRPHNQADNEELRSVVECALGELGSFVT